ncbi:MAG TPA: DUF1549 and DUF1553 domain-containing protein [Pirellulales bacterium]|nr:DUF1549 and DUF1553 domain-containing protein [Pirellulales bacterium]
MAIAAYLRVSLACRATVAQRAVWLLLASAFLPAIRAAGDDQLVLQPTELTFADAYARRQLLVRLSGRDVTADCLYESSNSKVVAVDEGGYVVAAGPGAAVVTVRLGGRRIEIPATVLAYDSGRVVDFTNEVVPLLSRFGCNSGGCHGKASGQNGFKLSLFGFDPAFDYDAIVLAARGRRVFPAAPARSLMLLKATASVPHGGGRRLDREAEPYRLLARWIEQGMPRSTSDAPRIARLTVEPRSHLMRADECQQLAVTAEYSDGSRRDVTREAQYASNLDIVAAVDDRGRVRCGQHTGEAAVMARYMGQVAVFRATVPHRADAAPEHAAPDHAAPDHAAPLGAALTGELAFNERNYIDRLVVARWKQLGLAPSPPADDATFLRRVTLDLCGRLPTAAEARAFLVEPSPTKRDQLVDRLLASPDYPAFFALRWGSILRNSRLAGADQAAYAFHDWIKSMIARNRPYDEFVRGVVAAAGEWQDAPAINWYWQMRDDPLHQPTADTAQVFLGIRLQCARCHHHPYERWGQDDYFGLAGFFTRLGRKSFGEPPPYFSAPTVTTGERDPLTGRAPEPKYPDGATAKFSPDEDPRHALVDWMAAPQNPYFAKALVNRLWGHFLGRGLVEPVDDLRDTNPPSNPELLDALARDFVEHQFDVKHVIRAIVTSGVYQLDSPPTADNREDHQNFARFYARRLIAEVLLDAVDQACGTRTHFDRAASTARAVDLPHEGFGSYFLDTFDRPQRVTGCECERTSGATLGQVLLLSNSEEIEAKIAAGDGIVERLLKERKPAAEIPIAEIVDELYLGALARLPGPSERDRAIGFVTAQDATAQQEPRIALQDLLWVLINSKEFIFNH